MTPQEKKVAVVLATLAETTGINIAALYSDIETALDDVFDDAFDSGEAPVDLLTLIGHGYHIEVFYTECDLGISFVVTVSNRESSLYEYEEDDVCIAAYGFKGELEAHEAAFAVHKALIISNPYLFIMT